MVFRTFKRRPRTPRPDPSRPRVYESGLEPLEPRLLLAADASIRSIQWSGRSVDARADAWIVEADPAIRLPLPAGGPAWTARDLGEGFYAVTTPTASTRQVLDWAAATPGIRGVEPDFAIGRTALPNDPSLGQLWGLDNTGQSGGLFGADINAPQAWSMTTGSRSVVVAVIDTGFDYNHPDLAANAWRNPGEIPGDGIDNDRNGFVDDVHGWDFSNGDADPMDDEGHGTHVSGTIGAVGNNGVGVTGVAWQVSIMGLKFMDNTGSGYTSDAVAAINYATRMRRDFGVNVVATNNSWAGGDLSVSLRDAIENGGRAGILFVAAAGNKASNNDLNPSYPASSTSSAVIAVAATDRWNRLASFSNFGPTSVDLAAPGVGIYSTTPDDTYDTYSGTSMATPFVTGTVALLASAARNATAAQIRSAILSNTTPLASLRGNVATGGLLNAEAALAALTGTPITPPPTPEPPPPPSPRPAAAPEPNETMAAATAVGLAAGSARYSGRIGDGRFGGKDVDLFRVALKAGQRLTIQIDARSLVDSSTLDSYLRVFNASGRQLAANDDFDGSYDSLLSFTAGKTATFYVGISGYGNTNYTPSRAGSGKNGSTGVYEAGFSVSAATGDGATPGAFAAGPHMTGFPDEASAQSGDGAWMVRSRLGRADAQRGPIRLPLDPRAIGPGVPPTPVPSPSRTGLPFIPSRLP